MGWKLRVTAKACSRNLFGSVQVLPDKILARAAAASTAAEVAS